MPRRTVHKLCDECWEEETRVCTYLFYYEVLGTRARAGSRHNQVTGHLPPTEGWCLECFLKIAAKRGSSKAKIRELRQKFKLPHPTKQEKGSSPKKAPKRVGQLK